MLQQPYELSRLRALVPQGHLNAIATLLGVSVLRLEKRCRTFDVGLREHRVLAAVAGGLSKSQSEIAMVTCIHVTSIPQIMSRLIAAGLITIEEKTAGEVRGRRYRLLSKGNELLSVLEEETLRAEDDCVHSLSALFQQIDSSKSPK